VCVCARDWRHLAWQVTYTRSTWSCSWRTYLATHPVLFVGRDSLVVIAAGYELYGPRIEFRWGARLSAPVQTGSGTHPAFCAIEARLSPRIKRPGRDDHPLDSSAYVKRRIDLYRCFLPGSLWPVIGWTLPTCCYWLSHIAACISISWDSSELKQETFKLNSFHKVAKT
jgi:hypothetical protein